MSIGQRFSLQTCGQSALPEQKRPDGMSLAPLQQGWGRGPRWIRPQRLRGSEGVCGRVRKRRLSFYYLLVLRKNGQNVYSHVHGAVVLDHVLLVGELLDDLEQLHGNGGAVAQDDVDRLEQLVEQDVVALVQDAAEYVHAPLADERVQVVFQIADSEHLVGEGENVGVHVRVEHGVFPARCIRAQLLDRFHEFQLEQDQPRIRVDGQVHQELGIEVREGVNLALRLLAEEFQQRLMLDQLLLVLHILADEHQAEQTQLQQLFVPVHLQTLIDHDAQVYYDIPLGPLVVNYVQQEPQPLLQQPLVIFCADIADFLADLGCRDQILFGGRNRTSATSQQLAGEEAAGLREPRACMAKRLCIDFWPAAEASAPLTALQLRNAQVAKSEQAPPLSTRGGSC